MALQTPTNQALRQTLTQCRSGLKAVLLFSFVINLLMLAAPLYMLQVFDRVIGSGSTDTLLYLSLVTLFAIMTLAALEVVRGRIMLKLGLWFEQTLGPDALKASLALGARSQKQQSVQGLRDIATIRNFLTGSSVFPIMDAPWLPIFLAIIFMLHPMLGWMATIGAITLLALAIINDRSAKKALQNSSSLSIDNMKQAEAAVHNANVVMAMGFMHNLSQRWQKQNQETLDALETANQRSSALSAVSKFIRLGLQIGIMGAGAWLVLGNEMTAGGMVAGSILLGRALAPVDQAIGSWKNAIAARSAYQRLSILLNGLKAESESIELPDPQGNIKVENMLYAYSPEQPPVLRGINFELQPGELLGIIGPTASGKSTLADLLVGNTIPESGHIRFDGADIHRLNPNDRRNNLGYLPQDIELFAGTISENIACMGEIDSQAVIAAAQKTNLHEMILNLPQGYETDIGDAGAVLAGGQRQRLALARALYANPRLLVLDEPNASLDFNGDAALLKTLEQLKAEKTTTIVISHRPSILQNADKILVLQPGGRAEFGSREEMFNKVTKPLKKNPENQSEETGHANIRSVSK